MPKDDRCTVARDSRRDHGIVGELGQLSFFAGLQIALPQIERAVLSTDIVKPLAIGLPKRTARF